MCLSGFALHFSLHFRLRHQIRSKVMLYCSNEQTEPSTRTDWLLTELICQASTNRSERKRLVQFDSLLEWERAGVKSPKTELTQPRSQTGTWFLKIQLRNRIAVRDFHGGLATSLITFFHSDSIQSPSCLADCRRHPQIQLASHPRVGGPGDGDCQLCDVCGT